MKLQQVNSEEFEKRIRYYKDKSLIQLQAIIPKWAYGKDSDSMLDITLHPKTDEYSISLVSTEELIKISVLHEVNSNILFTGDKLNDGRVATILYRWDNNKFVDPPTVGIFHRDKSKLYFSDGRHRSKTSYLLGHKQIPIAVHKSEIDDVSKILRLISI